MHFLELKYLNLDKNFTDQASTPYLKQLWHSFQTHICVTRPQWVNVWWDADKNLYIAWHYDILCAIRFFMCFHVWTVLMGRMLWLHFGPMSVKTTQFTSFDRLFNMSFVLTWKKYQSFASLALCEENTFMTGRFLSEIFSSAESVSISWHQDAFQ